MFERKNRIKKFIENHPFWFMVVIVTLFVICVFLFRGFGYNFLEPINIKEKSMQCTANAGPEVDAFLYFVTGVATCILALIAYLQLNPIKKDIEGSFFLEVVKMYSSPENCKARYLIDRIFKDEEIKKGECVENIKKRSECYDGWKNTVLFEYMKRSENPKLYEEKHREILEFLNFLETLGHFYRMEYVTANQFYELMGSELLYYEALFKSYSEYARSGQEGALSAYSELCKALKCIKACEALKKCADTKGSHKT